MPSRPRVASLLMAVFVGLLALLPFTPVEARTETRRLRDAVTVDGIRAHQLALQQIASANGDTRSSGTPGYTASANYVYNKLVGAGYKVTRQPFSFTFPASAQLQLLSPIGRVYRPFIDVNPATLSFEGAVTGTVRAVDVVIPAPQVADGTSNSSGCDAADFAGFVAGSIALVQRGTCGFGVKAFNAQAAGAIGVIIFNEGNSPARSITLANFTLGTPGIGIPVVGVSYATGVDLYNLANPVATIRVVPAEQRTTENIIADSPKGRANSVVVVGAHLDSVPGGPGINDNGSGTATILEIALRMAELNINPLNKVRFAFWGAEERGLVGSTYYVNQLSEEELAKIALNLNFDMIGSPNFVRFVYDGDNSAFPVGPGAALGPEGSGFIEQVFVEYFNEQGLASAPTPFSGRSDYGPFIAKGIPAGGLFSGAEGLKTAAEAAVYGGTAGAAYDPCYHQLCDSYANNSNLALDQMSDAATHATMYFVTTPSPFKERGKSFSAPNNGGSGSGSGSSGGLLEHEPLATA